MYGVKKTAKNFKVWGLTLLGVALTEYFNKESQSGAELYSCSWN